MRDGTTIALHEQTAKREGLILQQLHYLKTRQEAFEKVLYQSNVLKRIAYIIFPAYLLTTVDTMQDVLINIDNQAYQNAVKKPKIQVVHGAIQRPN